MAMIMLPSNAVQRRPQRAVTFSDMPYVGTPTGLATPPGYCTPGGTSGTPNVGMQHRSPQFNDMLLAGMAPSPYGMTELAGLPLPEHHRGGRPVMRKAHTMTHMMQVAQEAVARADAQDPFGMVDMTGGQEFAQRRTRRAKTWGAERFEHVAVSVVAPGGGTGCNAHAYAALNRMEGFEVAIQGQSRAPYDRYPPCYGADGGPAPNLESFAMDLMAQGVLESSDCIVFGSRGGQVVLPTFWRMRGDAVPPVVVINGGCAMGGPIQIQWPESAVTFLLLGGQDYFKQNHSHDSYVADAQSRVPRGNASTAILFVHEMGHMPQGELLMAVLHHMIHAVTSWNKDGQVPEKQFHAIHKALACGRWSGSLTYKTAAGGKESWQGARFP